MDTRALAGTDLQTSRIVFGTMTFGSQVDESEAAAMVRACLDAGVTLFDTANSYNGGAAEEILGKAIGSHRDELLIASKVGSQNAADPGERGLSKAAIERAVDQSLRRLGTDHLDLYYLHMPDHDTPVEESLEALQGQVQAGKIRYAASSNYAAWQLCEMLWLSERHGWQPLKVSQTMYNLLARRIEDEYVPFARRCELSTIVYNPLAGGLLTGKHRFQEQPAEGTRFTRQMYHDRYWNERQFEAVEELKGIAADAGLSLLELSYRWLLSRPVVDHMLLGASSLEQLTDNLRALDGPAPDPDTEARCDEVWTRLAGAVPSYNR